MQEKLREEIHSINNLLNKITTQAGMARYYLEEKGFDPAKIEEEKERLIKVLDNMEENAMNIGELLKKLHKSIETGRS